MNVTKDKLPGILRAYRALESKNLKGQLGPYVSDEK